MIELLYDLKGCVVFDLILAEFFQRDLFVLVDVKLSKLLDLLVNLGPEWLRGENFVFE